ncbi:MAG: putative membrane protein YfcA, partial [Alteromonadaceae bacterium]
MNIIEFIINNISPILALVATGVFAGILAGLLGVGGGIVIVPVLFFLFQSFGVSPESAMLVATATSLATIVPTSISSIRSHTQKGNVDFDLLKRWALF